MQKIITKEEVLKIAKISQIAVNSEQVQKLTNDIEAVLEYASFLDKIASVKQISVQEKNTNVFRSDISIKFYSEPLLNQAPSREENYFVVPAIIKQN